MARLLGFPISPDTLIRWQRQERFAFPAPLALGVDEFALLRGHTYGTLLVDLLRRRPIDLLDGKSADSLAAWLREHPEVAILARDRDDSYALAGRLAAPDALQVADRFHLARNVSDALQDLLRSRRWATPEDADSGPPAQQATAYTRDVGEAPRAPRPTPLKQARWEAVQEARRRGLSARAIAGVVGINRQTVRKYLQAGSPPVYQRHRPRPKKVTPYLNYLRQRWAEGCHNARQLYRELLSLGYPGCEGQVRAAVHPWRRLPRPPPQVRAPPFRWLLLCPAGRLGEEERWRLRRFLEANPPLALGHRVKERFLHIVREGYVGGLEPWLHAAQASGLPTFQSVARGLRRDYEAVRMALVLPWSTAQCEGQICRLKLIKRIGYGRAKPDLLRQRVLHRPPALVG